MMVVVCWFWVWIVDRILLSEDCMLIIWFCMICVVCVCVVSVSVCGLCCIFMRYWFFKWERCL